MDYQKEIEDGCRYGPSFKGKGYVIKPSSGSFCICDTINGRAMVFIECNVPEFSDRFNSVSILTDRLTIDGGTIVDGVILKSDFGFDNMFGLLANDFINYIDNNRNGVINIQSWCDGWKELLGNSNASKIVYDAVGELLVLHYLATKNHNPVWGGPDSNRHDIGCTDRDCEVKSSVIRNMEPIIHVSGGRQLVPSIKPLFLYVCQFEKVPNGSLSINVIVNSLRSMGYPVDKIVSKLDGMGLYTTEYRNIGFNLLYPIKEYRVVKGMFPIISEESFIGGEYPDHVINITYTLNLGKELKYQPIDVDVDGSGSISYR